MSRSKEQTLNRILKTRKLNEQGLLTDVTIFSIADIPMIIREIQKHYQKRIKIYFDDNYIYIDIPITKHMEMKINADDWHYALTQLFVILNRQANYENTIK